jgi:hypothetical protein
MEAEPVQGFSASIYTELKDPFRSGDSDAVIQACYELLSPGVHYQRCWMRQNGLRP